MAFKLSFTDEAKGQLESLKSDPKKLKKVRKCLGMVETDPKHPGLRSHKYSQMKSDDNKGVFESYVEKHSTGVWRVFWIYGPESIEITVKSITGHP